MNLDVPNGSDAAAPEQPKPEAPVDGKNDDVEKPSNNSNDSGSNNNSKSSSKALIIVAVVGLLAIAGLLIGLLPDWDKKKANKNLETPDNNENPSDSGNKTAYFESKTGPFEVKLPLFSADITKDYVSIDEAKGDIEQLARFLLNGAILSNIASGQQNPEYGGEDEKITEGNGFAGAPEAPSAPGGDLADDASQSAPVSGATGGDDLGSANDFETNNQEENVDRADLAKSDGKFLFVAYGDYVLVVTADGLEEIARIEVPPVVLPPGYEQGYPSGGGDGYVPPPSDVIDEEPTVDSGSAASSGGTPSNAAMDEPMMVDSGFAAMPPFFWNPKPYVDALLIEGNRLAIVASGYSVEHTMMPMQGSGQEQWEAPIFWDYQNTKIHLYDINDGNVEFVTTQTLNGSFRDAFSMAGSGYVVTQAGMNTWERLLGPIQRWQARFAGLNDDEYLALATQIARDLIPGFVSSLVDELQANGPVDLTRLSLYSDSVSDDGESEISLFADGIANAVTHIVSFDMLETVAKGGELTVDIDATFQPGYWGHVYAHEQMIIIADQGWNWDEEDQVSAQMTYLLGFRLDGPSATHSVVGSVPGHILSPYSVDFVEVDGDSFVRLATTQNFWTRWMIARPVDSIAVGGDMMVVEDEADGGEMASTTTIVAEPEPAIEPETEPSTASTTLNQIIVLKFPSEESSNVEENVLEIVGQEEMGKPNESFTTVRFFDNVAYAVTYERIDPFYVVDLSDPYDPEVLGSLDVPGFSEYLHPINSDNTILAAVGQLTDENSGRQLGMQISVFDARDPLNPTLLARLPITEDGDNSWSYSPVSWDPRAFRFLRLGDGVGRLIMPISTYTVPDAEIEAGEVKPEPEQFEGFVMFAIDINAGSEDLIIQRVLDIDHTDSMGFQDGFYYCSWLPERSFVIDGNLITMKAHSIVSTELTSSDTKFILDVDEMGGCPMYYF